MDRKSIGQFLSALRKANGYTQQEVAEKLGVSNKTLSSWETDKTCPDLTLIPVLADLYGVTSDEILRGERRKAEERESERRAAQENEHGENGTIGDEKVSERKTSKSVRAILKTQVKKFRFRNYILRGAIGASWLLIVLGVFLFLCVNVVAGIIVGVIGAIGMIAAIAVLQAFFVGAISFAEQDEDGDEGKWDTEAVADYTRRVAAVRNATCQFILVPFFAATVPVLIIAASFMGNSVNGDNGLWEKMLFPAALFVLSFAVLWAGAFWFQKCRETQSGAKDGKARARINRRFFIAFGACVAAFVLSVLSVIYDFPTWKEKLYVADDAASFKRGLQTIEFHSYDEPVKNGAVPINDNGGYTRYFEIDEKALKDALTAENEYTYDLGDGFALEGTADYDMANGIKFYTNIRLVYGVKIAENVYLAYNVVSYRIAYHVDSDTFILQTYNYEASHLSVSVKKGKYVLYGTTYFVVNGIFAALAALCAPVAFTVCLLKTGDKEKRKEKDKAAA